MGNFKVKLVLHRTNELKRKEVRLVGMSVLNASSLLRYTRGLVQIIGEPI